MIINIFEKNCNVLSKYKIAFYCVNRFIQDPIAKKFSQNLTEFWCHDFKDYNIDTLFFASHDEALVEIGKSNDDFAIVFELGNAFQKNSKFLDEIKEVLDKNFYCMGHILDREEKYFELHSQVFILNVEKYKMVGKPSYFSEGPMKLCNVIRSKENFHDDYTPLWIKGGKGYSTYKVCALGAQIIHKGLEIGETVLCFPKSIRESKIFLYPRIDFKKNLPSFENFINNKINSFFAWNTEGIYIGRPKNLNRTSIAPLSRFFTPASGLNHFLFLEKTGFTCKNNGESELKILFFDYSKISLLIMKEIMTHWDGKNYPHFINTWCGFTQNKNNLDEKWKAFLDYFGGENQWLSWFNFLKSQSKLEFKYINAFEKNFPKVPWLGCFGSGDSFLNLSSIFHYSPNIGFYSAYDRCEMLNTVLLFLKKKHPNLWVKFCFPYQTDNNNDKEIVKPKGNLIQAKDFEILKTNSFPWSRKE